MNRKHVKRWLPEITHWANGGELWFYQDKEWIKYDGGFISTSKCAYVIEDKHFEARKAHSLGEPIEVNLTLSGTTPWTISKFPVWSDMYNYRPKKKKEWHDNIPEDGILCWVWTTDEDEGYIVAIVNKKHSPAHRNWSYETTDCDTWRYAKPIKPEDLWKEQKCANT